MKKFNHKGEVDLSARKETTPLHHPLFAYGDTKIHKLRPTAGAGFSNWEDRTLPGVVSVGESSTVAKTGVDR